MSGFSNQPRILRGAFVEYGLSIPPLYVAFQFNPEQLTRNRSLSYEASASAQTKGQKGSLRDFHQKYNDLTKLQKDQVVTIQEETISFRLRLDASDPLNEGNPIPNIKPFGITPQLSTLELMLHPKAESFLGKALNGFSFTRTPNPPLVLFVWGRKRVLPVNITSLNITEMLYTPNLEPLRATATVNLTVIEGPSPPYLASKAAKEVMSAFHLANPITTTLETTNVVIPG